VSINYAKAFLPYSFGILRHSFNFLFFGGCEEGRNAGNPLLHPDHKCLFDWLCHLQPTPGETYLVYQICYIPLLWRNDLVFSKKAKFV